MTQFLKFFWAWVFCFGFLSCKQNNKNTDVPRPSSESSITEDKKPEIHSSLAQSFTPVEVKSDGGGVALAQDDAHKYMVFFAEKDLVQGSGFEGLTENGYIYFVVSAPEEKGLGLAGFFDFLKRKPKSIKEIEGKSGEYTDTQKILNDKTINIKGEAFGEKSVKFDSIEINGKNFQVPEVFKTDFTRLGGVPFKIRTEDGVKITFPLVEKNTDTEKLNVIKDMYEIMLTNIKSKNKEITDEQAVRMTSQVFASMHQSQIGHANTKAFDKIGLLAIEESTLVNSSIIIKNNGALEVKKSIKAPVVKPTDPKFVHLSSKKKKEVALKKPILFVEQKATIPPGNADSIEIKTEYKLLSGFTEEEKKQAKGLSLASGDDETIFGFELSGKGMASLESQVIALGDLLLSASDIMKSASKYSVEGAIFELDAQHKAYVLDLTNQKIRFDLPVSFKEKEIQALAIDPLS